MLPVYKSGGLHLCGGREEVLEEQDDELLGDADCQEELARPACQKIFEEAKIDPAEKKCPNIRNVYLGGYP